MNMLVNSPKDQTPQKLYLRIYRPLLSKKPPQLVLSLHCCIETNHKTSERLQALRQMRKQGNETQNFTINTPHQLSNYDQKIGHSAEQWSQAQKQIYNRIAEKRKNEGAAMAQSPEFSLFEVLWQDLRESCAWAMNWSNFVKNSRLKFLHNVLTDWSSCTANSYFPLSPTKVVLQATELWGILKLMEQNSRRDENSQLLSKW